MLDILNERLEYLLQKGLRVLASKIDQVISSSISAIPDDHQDMKSNPRRRLDVSQGFRVEEGVQQIIRYAQIRHDKGNQHW